MQLGKGILCVFLVWDGVPGALDASSRVPWGGSERLIKRDGYRYELMLLQHDFNHIEPC